MLRNHHYPKELFKSTDLSHQKLLHNLQLTLKNLLPSTKDQLFILSMIEPLVKSLVKEKSESFSSNHQKLKKLSTKHSEMPPLKLELLMENP